MDQVSWPSNARTVHGSGVYRIKTGEMLLWDLRDVCGWRRSPAATGRRQMSPLISLTRLNYELLLLKRAHEQERLQEADFCIFE